MTELKLLSEPAVTKLEWSAGINQMIQLSGVSTAEL